MKSGFSVASAIKALGALGTMLGWWGWARLSRVLLQRGLAAGTGVEMGRRGDCDLHSPAVHPAVGRDRHLPVGHRAVGGGMHGEGIGRERTGSWWFDVFAGGLCGLAMLMRYASLFLMVYAAGIMLWQSRARIPTLTRRWSAFGAGALPALALQGYINYVLSNSPVMPGGLFDAAREGRAPPSLGRSAVAPPRRLSVGVLGSRQRREPVVCRGNQRPPMAAGADGCVPSSRC